MNNACIIIDVISSFQNSLYFVILHILAFTNFYRDVANNDDSQAYRNNLNSMATKKFFKFNDAIENSWF